MAGEQLAERRSRDDDRSRPNIKYIDFGERERRQEMYLDLVFQRQRQGDESGS